MSCFGFDSLIHLQDSQTDQELKCLKLSLIHLFTYKTLKLYSNKCHRDVRLIHLFTYKTLKQEWEYCRNNRGLIHLFTYKTLKLWISNFHFIIVWFTYSLTRLSNSCCHFPFCVRRLIHLFTYKTLKHCEYSQNVKYSLIHLFTYKTLKHEL